MNKASIICTTSACPYMEEELKISVRFRERKLADKSFTERLF